MATKAADTWLRGVWALTAGRGAGGEPDQDVLDRFVRQRDAATFAAIVGRHGPMVLGVCRRALRDEHAAEDVFQATFLVLARNAGTIRNGRSLGEWLHGIALRLARKARATAVRAGRADTRPAPEPPPGPAAEASWREVREILDDELARLPERYRVPLVLCYLEGRTREEAAAAMGCTPERVKGLLERGRERLRARLVRRGLAPAVVGSVLLTEAALATPAPPPLAAATIHAATRVAAGAALAPRGISAPVVALTEEGLRMTASNTRTLVLTLALVLGAIGSGAAILIQRGGPALAGGPKDGTGPGKTPERPTKAALDALLPAESRHTFGPVSGEWRGTVAYLLNDGGDDPPNSLRVVKPDERDPTFEGYYKEVRYAATEGGRDRRIRRYYPDGSLWCDMDIVGDEQFDCSYGPDGTVRGYVHWRKGKWVGGYSVSPDGATVHRLAGGTGELVTHGNNAGNSEHRWYSEGVNFLSKRYRDGAVTSVRLNAGENWLIVDKSGEQLLASAEHEIWTKPAGGVPRVQRLDAEPHPVFDDRRVPDPGEVQRTAERYISRRAAFLARYGAALTAGGYAWDRLGIEFVRKGTTWPY